ncbi:MAG: T9SS type A sorting domain-containing protein [Crocinitomicaceae bacterium]|nr:T9SS type A sorting domain-containing protein [Crocinitomicaceae bacterium]MCF8410406.1 T9SS type A sorting domain-containing protein [Crocinitomicaceae bacterium]
MKHFKSFFLALLIVTTTNIIAQTKGIIYKPSTSVLGKSVLDPNGDGFVSTTNQGFASGQDWGTESEIKLITFPSLEGEPHSDLTTGSNGGHTDLVANALNTNQSSYVGVKNVGGIDYFIVRIRIGGASTATKGYSILIDTDGAFSAGLLSANNPGYDKEIVLETGNSGRVAIYNHTSGGTTLHNSYNLNEYHQRSVASSTINSDADYFYDFFVPLSGLGISTAQMIRMTAATVTSAQSGIAGTISDFNGIDDKKYSNDRTALMLALINTFPSASLDQLANENFTFSSPKTAAPIVNSGILTTSTSISGTSVESNGTTITVYKNNVHIGTTSVSSNAWTLTGVTSLSLGDIITAKAIASGKSLSDVSNSVDVFGSQPCYLVPPVITARSNGSRTLTGTATANATVTIYRINTDGTYTLATNDNSSGTNPTTATSLGAWGPIGKLGTNQTDFSNTSYVAKVTSNGCTSDYSLMNFGANGITTTAPQVMTTPIYQSASATSVSIKNNHASVANITFYVNGQLQNTQSNIAAGANATFSYSGFLENDTVYARAIGTATNSVLSGLSNKVVVTVSLTQTNAPVITGNYTSGSGKTVTGTSNEASGTTITLYKAGSTLIGTTTVSAFGTWSISGLTLIAADVLTSYAKASGKTLSSISNNKTVASSTPSAPVVTGSYTVGNTSISGTGGNGTVTVYVGGSPIGTIIGASGSWILSAISTTELYRGAIIHATNTVSTIESVISNQVTVTGVASFVITDENDSPLIEKISGDRFRIKVKAKDGNNGSGNDFTAFTNAVTLSSTTIIHDENISDRNFNTGILTGTDNTVTILGKGAGIKLIVVNPNDPSAFGETTVTIIPAEWMGQSSGDALNIKAHNQAENWTHSRVPATGASIKFATNAVQDLTLQTNYTWGDVDFNGNDKHIVLGNYNLAVESFTNRTANVVKTSGTGKLKITVPSGQTVTYPIANASNNFMLITNNADRDEEYSIRVLNGIYSAGTSGNDMSGARIIRTWDLHKETSNGSTDINIEFRYNNGEVIDYQSNLRFKMYHYTNGSWVIEKSQTNDSSSYSARFDNYTGTFSPFSIGDGIGEALPVELTSISSNCQDEEVEILWSTASEFNSNYYEVSLSRDGLIWNLYPIKIEAVHFSNTTTHYNLIVPQGYAFAKLNQVDIDGKETLYGPISIECTANTMSIFPNPANEKGYINFYLEKPIEVTMTLKNSLGSIVQVENISGNIGNNQKIIDFNSLPNGIYLLETEINGKHEIKKWILAQ